MSKSRSPTPTPNTFSAANTSLSSESTTSRTHSHEHIPSVPTLGGSEHRLNLRLTQPRSLPPLSFETGHRQSRSVRRPEASPADQPMAKRLRKESLKTQSGPTDKSSPSSDSQDDMADTEMDDRKTQQSEVSAPPAAPPKKKRTRTLTTPHQSAILHALLAQSRFPTTAMREEVGRSIGLSARKVQIWFQNQRQKARRPRSQSDTSRKRFPQYGPFPSGPESSTLGSFSLTPDQGPSSRMSHAPYSAPPGSAGYPTSRGYHPSESISASLESPTQLLGPGMPGTELQPDVPYRGRPATTLRPSTAIEPCLASSSRRAGLGQHFVRSPSPTRLYPLPTPRPTTTSRLHDRDFSRTLPPLVFNSMLDRSNLSASGPHASASHPPFSGRSISPEATFAHHPPEQAFAYSLPIPPPYTLQPRPQWDSSTLHSALRSSDTPSWSRRETSSASGSITPPTRLARIPSPPFVGNRRDGQGAALSQGAPPQRSGRYDPVRATFIYTTPTETPQHSSPEASGTSHRTDAHEEARDNRPLTPP